MPDYNLETVKSGRRVFFPLRHELNVRRRRVEPAELYWRHGVLRYVRWR